jgi:hypothetical protein
MYSVISLEQKYYGSGMTDLIPKISSTQLGARAAQRMFQFGKMSQGHRSQSQWRPDLKHQLLSAYFR